MAVIAAAWFLLGAAIGAALTAWVAHAETAGLKLRAVKSVVWRMPDVQGFAKRRRPAPTDTTGWHVMRSTAGITYTVHLTHPLLDGGTVEYRFDRQSRRWTLGPVVVPVAAGPVTPYVQNLVDTLIVTTEGLIHLTGASP
jgi:hypothetical protein